MDQSAGAAPIERQIDALLRRERFRQALSLVESPAAHDLPEARRLALQAEARAGLAEFEQADGLARRALAIYPLEARAYLVLGVVAAQAQRQPAEAAAYFRRAIEAAPDLAAAYHALGMLLLQADQIEPAAEMLRRAAVLEPANWRYAAGVALIAPPRARPAALRAAYRAGLAERPGSPGLRLRVLGTYLAGLVAPIIPERRGSTAQVGIQAYRALLARPALVTYVLLTINVAMFLLLESQGSSQNDATLDRFGAKDDAAIVHQHQWWRLLAPVFLHAGATHLLVNGASLYFVGVLYERCVGRARFLYVYLFAGVGGSLASFALSDSLSVGASGAIFGIFGALGVYFFRNRALFGPIARSLVRQVLFLSVVNLLLPNLVQGIDGWGHAGGLAAGIVAALVVGPVLPAAHAGMAAEEALRDRRPRAQVIGWCLAAATLLAAIAGLLIAWNPTGS